MTTLDKKNPIRRFTSFRWEQTDLLAYKEDGSPFKAITRQTLFRDPALKCELRYFEVAPGGYSTLERHEHMHAVLVLRGRGECLVGNEVTLEFNAELTEKAPPAAETAPAKPAK